MMLEELLNTASLLTSSLLLHVDQRRKPNPWPLFDKKESPKHTAPPIVHEAEAVPAPVAPATPPKPPPQKAIQKATQEELAKPQAVEFFPQSVYLPFLHTLSSATKATIEPQVEDMRQKLASLGAPLRLDPISQSASYSWKQLYPQYAIVCCFAAGSPQALFLQKVADAMNTRLQKRTLFASTSLQNAAELLAFASCGTLQTLIYACDQSSLMRAKEWLSYFPSLESNERHLPPLIGTKQLFSSQLYELPLPQDYEHSVSFKAALWQAIQKL